MSIDIHSSPVFLAEVDADSLAGAVRDVPTSLTPVILLGEDGVDDLPRRVEELRSLGRDFVGGLFPRVISGSESYSRGAVVMGLAARSSPVVVRGLGSGNIDLPFPMAAAWSGCTLLVLLDGLAGHIGSFLRRLYGYFGTDTLYLGAGAGSLSFEQRPCVFCQSGIYQDAALVVPVSQRIGLGVRHGWTRLMGPLIATAVDGTTIKELNWQPAMGVYRQIVEPEVGHALTKDNFYEASSRYPFGLERHDSEDIVRDPVRFDADGSIVCVGDVASNSIVYILQGDVDTLVESAAQAAKDSVSRGTDSGAQGLVVDCVSRALLLKERFPEELAAIHEQLQRAGCESTVGVLSLGEISSVGDGFVQFLNKTTVVGSLS